MRVAFIHPRFPSAEGTGATHSATQIVNGLADNGHDITVYCPKRPPSDHVETNIDLEYLNPNNNHPHTNTKLNKALLERIGDFEKFDVVHSYLSPLVPAIGTIGSELDIGTVVTLNAYGAICAKNDLLYKDESRCESMSTRKCINCISRTGFSDNEHGYFYQTASQLFSINLINSGQDRLKHIDAFRAPSKHVRDNYVQFGFSPEKISVIPHPVDEKFLIPHRSCFEEPYRLLYVGSLDRHKGVQKLIPILDSLNNSGSRFRLTVVGTGGLQSKLRKEARNRGISHLVEITGFIPNNKLPKVYANHDCFLYPGIWEEPLGRVYLEALSTGTPIVSSNYGSITEIMGEGGVTTDGSITGFRDKILEVVENERLPELSRAAKSHVEHYNREQIISQIEEMYEDKL